MSKMVLGGLVLPIETDLSPIIKPKRHTSKVQTLEGVAFFSFGVTIKGRDVTIKWDGMTATQYDQIQALVEADTEVPWVPVSGEATSYTVEIEDFTGEYHSNLYGTTTRWGGTAYRKKCELKLLIME